MRFHLRATRSRVTQEFAPSTVTFPEGTKIPPPEQPKPEPRKEEKKP